MYLYIEVDFCFSFFASFHFSKKFLFSLRQIKIERNALLLFFLNNSYFYIICLIY
ncbi:unnamed protein product [Meloidogyne enterolobii]|uniref:Uncharacterized protein n=1 Tax=Meloidogyne enterolobii TaxID=390850 RepID=A0ACB1AAW0_MELEN